MQSRTPGVMHPGDWEDGEEGIQAVALVGAAAEDDAGIPVKLMLKAIRACAQSTGFDRPTFLADVLSELEKAHCQLRMVLPRQAVVSCHHLRRRGPYRNLHLVFRGNGVKAPATDLEDVGIKLALKNTQLGLGRVCVRR